MSEISVQCKYILRVNIRTPLKVIFGTKSIIGGLFRLSTQYVSQLLKVLNKKLNKTVILTCRCSMCIKNESTGKYTCSHAPYTCFTSVAALLYPVQWYFKGIIIFMRELTFVPRHFTFSTLQGQPVFLPEVCTGGS